MIDESKVHIICVGPGFGESTIVFLPTIGWGIVDSCKIKNRNLALEVADAFQIKELAFLVLTHPHRDHFLGMDEIIEKYKGKIGKICCYHGTGLRQYLTYLTALNQLQSSSYGTSNLNILSNIYKKFKDAQASGSELLRLSENTFLFRKRTDHFDIEVEALSPSFNDQEAFEELFFRAIPRSIGDLINTKLDKEHNLISVALRIRVNNTSVIIGGDVESGDNEHSGWARIMSNKGEVLKSSFIRIPHHGSDNAFHDGFWSLQSDAISTATLYNRGSKNLPEDAVLQKVISSGSQLYITGRHFSRSPTRIYQNSVVKKVRGKNWQIRPEPKQFGIVMTSLDPNNPSLANVQLQKPAYQFI